MKDPDGDYAVDLFFSNFAGPCCRLMNRGIRNGILVVIWTQGNGIGKLGAENTERKSFQSISCELYLVSPPEHFSHSIQYTIASRI